MTWRLSPGLAWQVRTALARQRARLMMTLLGLRECADTVIGEMGRGGIRYVGTSLTCQPLHRTIRAGCC